MQGVDVLPKVAMLLCQALEEQQRSWGQALWSGVWVPQSHGPGFLSVLVLSARVASGQGLDHCLTETIHAPQGCGHGQGHLCSSEQLLSCMRQASWGEEERSTLC